MTNLKIHRPSNSLPGNIEARDMRLSIFLRAHLSSTQFRQAISERSNQLIHLFSLHHKVWRHLNRIAAVPYEHAALPHRHGNFEGSAKRLITFGLQCDRSGKAIVSNIGNKRLVAQIIVQKRLEIRRFCCHTLRQLLVNEDIERCQTRSSGDRVS